MTGAPRPCVYRYRDRDEQLLCIGDSSAARRLLIVPPLFDEMNRMRRTLLLAMRALAERGVTCALPDLPGCNESLALLETQDLAGWRTAVEVAARALDATHIAAFRGGALIDDGTTLPRWRLAPANGSALLKTLIRTRIAGDREGGRTTSSSDLLDQAECEPVDLAGNRLGPAMVSALQTALPGEDNAVATFKLGAGDNMIAGSALWLRAEPGEDKAMAEAIAQSIDRWSAP